MTSKFEILTPSDWDEELYLSLNPDVRNAVVAGSFASGFAHYATHGLIEGRNSGYQYDTAIWPWSDALYLQNNPDLRTVALDGSLTLVDHYRRWGRYEGRKTGLESSREEFQEHAGLPAWVLDEMLSQSLFEPALDMKIYKKPWTFNALAKAEWTSEFSGLAKHLNHEKYDILFLLPWLKPGGADLAALFHIRAAFEKNQRVAVVTTEPGKSEWLWKLPKGVDVVPFGELVDGMEPVFKLLLLYSFYLAVSPAKIHIINSHVAWALLLRNPGVCSSIADVYVSLYCYDQATNGELVGYARNVRRCNPAITGIFTDNTAFKGHLVDDLGVDPDKVHVLAHPVEVPRHEAKRTNFPTKVLWASRLDRQKQPELLIKIAEALPNLTFDVYGSAVIEEGDRILSLLRSRPNISYKGPFNGIGDIPVGDYRCLLYTSLWDGLPNLVLEAIASGLLVVSSRIPGIEADIGPSNCILVDDYKNPGEFVQKLKMLYSNPAEADRIRLHGQAHVAGRHSWGKFVDQLQSARYIPSEGENPIG